MKQQLTRIEHGPPMSESVIWNSSVKVVRHEPVRKFASRPIIRKVGCRALRPLPIGGVEYVAARDRCKEATIVGLTGRVAVRAVALNCICCDGPCLPDR